MNEPGRSSTAPISSADLESQTAAHIRMTIMQKEAPTRAMVGLKNIPPAVARRARAPSEQDNDSSASSRLLDQHDH
eukprot:12938818-Heterocapsa_arctica.AAC.1